MELKEIPRYKQVGYLELRLQAKESIPAEAVGKELEMIDVRGNCATAKLRLPCGLELFDPFLDGATTSSIFGAGRRGRRGSGSDSGGAVKAVAKLVVKERIEVIARLTGVYSENQANARLTIYLPELLWAGLHRWKASQASAFVFSHLLRPSCKNEDGAACWTSRPRACPAGLCGVLGCTMHSPDQTGRDAATEARNAPHPAGRPQQDGHSEGARKVEEFTLAAVFGSLPSHTEQDLHSTQRELHTAHCTSGDPPVWPYDPGLCSLPQEALENVLQHCGHADLAAVAMTCRHLKQAAQAIVPGLQLALFPHQRVALHWMRRREAAPGLLHEHPHIRRLETSDGFPFSACLATGAVSPDPPEAVTDMRGGLFCDEPGLGKTVTCLALILKVRDARHDAISPTRERAMLWPGHSWALYRLLPSGREPARNGFPRAHFGRQPPCKQ
ncbi:tripeptidyl-peptidase II Tpp2 [Cymbomonas tetramitiformis]|uniref:Tripeptidyl-peptidase II Tpp2 n=1 Tax=Cymbomonas tetramitiformis TaxID=36881 RepID=A0AAE0GFE9_9CHLO|nr:tripeptidyl-peptidase II Tpp2 [Cymbomonas tetramitiformis]